MDDNIAATAALAIYLNAIDTEYGVHAAAFVAAGFKKAHELQHCWDTDVPTVPVGALRIILAKAAGMKDLKSEFCMSCIPRTELIGSTSL